MGKSLLKVFVFFSLIIILAITLVEISVKDTEKFKVIRKQEFIVARAMSFCIEFILKKKMVIVFGQKLTQWAQKNLI